MVAVTVKNYMERAVRDQVSHLEKSGLNGRQLCWCGLCEADTVSLSLSMLPPGYCMPQSYGILRDRLSSSSVRNVVTRAATRVLLRPKHPAGLPDYYPHQVQVVNHVQEEAAAMVRGVMSAAGAPCLCFQCQADVLAYSLNRVQPLYGVELDGVRRLPPDRLDFLRHDISLVLQEAVRVVARQPHH